MRLRSMGCGPLFPSFAALSLAAESSGVGEAASDLAESLPVATPPAGMSASVIPTGSVESRASRAFSGGRSDDIRRFALSAVMVRHPRGDLLFDAGVGSQWRVHRQALPWIMRKATTVVPGVPAARQLASSGYELAQLAGIVLTHAHWDHISGTEDFPGTPIWINSAESAFISSGHRSTRAARGIGPLAIKPYAFDGGPYLGFAASCDIWSDGSIVLVPTPGHTPGSVTAFISLPSGRRFALIGDIVWQMEGITEQVPKPWLSRLLADHAPREVLQLIRSLARLHARHPSLRLIPSHDEGAMSSLPTWPDRAV